MPHTYGSRSIVRLRLLQATASPSAIAEPHRRPHVGAPRQARMTGAEIWKKATAAAASASDEAQQARLEASCQLIVYVRVDPTRTARPRLRPVEMAALSLSLCALRCICPANQLHPRQPALYPLVPMDCAQSGVACTFSSALIQSSLPSQGPFWRAAAYGQHERPPPTLRSMNQAVSGAILPQQLHLTCCCLVLTKDPSKAT
ncbi:hypothetical protein B0I35DRAFT_46196 [Stachybotrys elegans]|uniref:Uncharacterized protein n=1 Tax=Stachybotrys elegans TaxID=80388 RepID=A0A8K0T0J0_9HYPO|nr:hypothetical protein B0I35DRAFT_46196 [Stachybotrys elegans]